MKTKRIFFISLSTSIIMLIFGGCASRYIPSVVNAPMLKNKGEIQASVNGGTSGFSSKIAYGITDNIGVMLNGSFANRDSSENNSDIHKHNYAELAGGYFKPIGTNGIFDVYMGYGYGNIKTAVTGWSVSAWNTEADFINQRFFIQPSIGYYNKITDLNFATKLSLVSISKNSYNKSVFFITPVATFKVGFKHIRFITQLGASIKTGDDNDNFDYNPFVGNVGLEIDLFRKYE